MPVFVSALERPDRSPEWLEEKRRQEGKLRTQRNYPLSAEEAFASASEPYFSQELVEGAQEHAPPPSPARPGDRYVKAWDVGRKYASVCVVLRAPFREEAPIWQVVEYTRLLGQDFPAIQAEIEKMHREYPGPTVIEVNSIGRAILENLRLPADELIPYTTSQVSKQAMLTEIEMLLQERTLKIHPDFGQLLAELGNYRQPDGSITQDSVMALGFAVSNRRLASASGTGGRILVDLMRELNGGGSEPPQWWLDTQKFATDGLSYGLVRVVREVSDPRELSAYKADAFSFGLDGHPTELEAMLAEGWTIAEPAALDKLGLRLDEDGKLERISS